MNFIYTLFSTYTLFIKSAASLCESGAAAPAALVRGCLGEDPRSICSRNGYADAIATTENLDTLRAALHAADVPHAYVGGWHDQVADFIMHCNGALAPFDPLNHTTDHAFCVAKSAFVREAPAALSALEAYLSGGNGCEAEPGFGAEAAAAAAAARKLVLRETTAVPGLGLTCEAPAESEAYVQEAPAVSQTLRALATFPAVKKSASCRGPVAPPAGATLQATLCGDGSLYPAVGSRGKRARATFPALRRSADCRGLGESPAPASVPFPIGGCDQWGAASLQARHARSRAAAPASALCSDGVYPPPPAAQLARAAPSATLSRSRPRRSSTVYPRQLRAAPAAVSAAAPAGAAAPAAYRAAGLGAEALDALQALQALQGVGAPRARKAQKRRYYVQDDEQLGSLPYPLDYTLADATEYTYTIQ